MKKLTLEQVKKEFAEKGFIVIGEYKGVSKPITVICPNGHKLETLSLTNLRKGCGCSICSGKAKLSYKYVKEQFEKEGYTLISKTYKNANTKLKVKCPNGHIWETTYAHFYDGKRCGICSNNKRFSYEEVKKYFEDNGYELLSEEYVNSSTPLILKCPNGHITNTMTLNNFKRGRRCKICNISKGEQEIMNFLNKNNIEYHYNEEYFPNLKSENGYSLRPDFIIPKLNIWIEYDGEFHFKKMYENDGFEKIQIYDEIKNNYAKNFGWNLIRISYLEKDNIENILQKEVLNKH